MTPIQKRVRVVILQKYLAPYRIPLFNRIASHPEVDLHLLHYGSIEKRRKWQKRADKQFTERQAMVLSRRLSYEYNFDLPVSLVWDLIRLKPDVVIAALDLGGLAASICKRFKPFRLVVWSEAISTGEKDIEPSRLRLRRYIASAAESFIVPGALACKYIKMIRPGVAVHMANNSIENEDIELSIQEVVSKFVIPQKTITFSGSLIERKGVHLLLRAFKELLAEKPEVRKRWKLRLLGTGPMDVTGFHDKNTLFEGFCEGERYTSFMRQSHVFIMPSLHDPNPLTVIEALFTGNVIIVSDTVGNYPEAVFRNGIVIGSNSKEEIKTALRRIFFAHNSELERMATLSIEQSKWFTIRRSAEGFLSAIGCRPSESKIN